MRVGMISCAGRMGGSEDDDRIWSFPGSHCSPEGLAEAFDAAGIDGSLPVWNGPSDSDEPVVPSRRMSK